MARNYASEYKNYHKKPEQKLRRAGRNAARNKLASSGVVSKGDGNDVDHVDRNPNNNAPGNLRVQSMKRNRSRNSLLGRRRTLLG
tara:strand:+ start:2982 stop:3236 length:255 start_codon:yes stop_codon:yes gene_type:complete